MKDIPTIIIPLEKLGYRATVEPLLTFNRDFHELSYTNLAMKILSPDSWAGTGAPPLRPLTPEINAKGYQHLYSLDDASNNNPNSESLPLYLRLRDAPYTSDGNQP
jgi:hypothetical protein